MAQSKAQARLRFRERKHKQVLRRLAVDSKDAGALVALYEDSEVEIRAAAVRWLGKDRELCERAIHNILVALGRQAPAYDPQSMNVGEWVRQCADSEARRLRDAIDTVNAKGQRIRRKM